MEKLIINRVQEKAFLDLKELIDSKKRSPLEYFLNNRDTWFNVLEPIKDFTEEEFMRLWCGWYEVKNYINVNDWVYDSVVDKYRKVVDNDTSMDIRYLDIIIVEEDLEGLTKIEDYWKIALLELGREIPEFKEGDKYETVKGIHHTISCITSEAVGHAQCGEIKYFYPVESRIKLK